MANISINALPTADAGIDQYIWQGDNATLTASGGTNYQWSDGAGNTASIIVNPATTTIYTVTVSDAAACSSTDDVTVIVNNAADAGADNSTTVCDNSGEGTSTVDLSTLVSAAGGVFAPIGGAPALAGTTFDGEGLPTGNYEYSYTVAGIAPCPDDVATISITVNDCAACPNPPTAGFSYASPFCVGVGTASITLNAGAAAGLFTANPAGLSINATTGQVDLVASTAGTYTVVVTDAANSTTNTTFAITNANGPAITRVNISPQTCENTGELVRLDRKTRKPLKRDTGQHIYSQLLGYARNKGWRDGWAFHAYKDFAGAGPQGLLKVASTPSTEMLGWIKSRQIAASKAREKSQEGRRHG